jgi:hypothetical protein
MALPKDFWEQLSQKSDAELYDILAHKEDYLPEALIAATDQLKKRNLAPEKLAELESDVERKKAIEDTKAQEPLSWFMRIFIFVFCSGLFGAMFAVYYSNQGYKKKASDCWITLALSVAFHIVIGVLLRAGR